MLYERTVYNSLDWFGNLGGLSEGLKMLCSVFLWFLNFNYYNNYMVTKLFNYESKDTGPKKTSSDRRKQFK